MTSPVLEYGRVEDWIGGLVMDGLDSDDLPDDVALTGTVKLEPMLAESAGGIRVPTMPKWLSVQPITCSYVNGRLTHRGLPYVMLLAPNEATNPTNWKWQASFDLRLNGAQVVRKQFAFVLPVYDPDAALVAGRNPTVVNLTTVQPVNVPGSGTGIVQGPPGFSISGVEIVEDGIQFYRDAPGSPGGQVPVGVPVPLPAGSGEVPADSIDAAKLAPAVREKVESAITDTEADARYTPALTPDSSRPGLYFFSGAVAADGALAAASSYYKSAALASGTTRLKLLTLGDSTNDGFGAPGGPSSWAKVWPQRLAELLRAQLGRPAGGRGWIPPSPPVGPGSYSFNTAQQLPAGRTLDALNVPTFQTGIPGSLWLQRGHASNADEVVYTLSAGVTAVDVLTTGYSGNMIITAANAGSSITKSSVGDRVITRITNPGATLSIRGDVGVGLAILGIIEHVGDEGAGVTQVNLSQASIRAFEVAGWLTGSDKSTLPLIDAYDPHVALITLGSNDKGTGRTQAEMSSAMSTIVDRLRSAVAQMEIVFIVRPDSDAAWTAYGNNIVSTASTLGVRSLDLRGKLTSSSLYVADGVHFNEAGENAMADLVLDYMKVGV
ncbi:Phage tail fiber protein [Rhodococcus sp. B7740]|uniref:SGNH/GDSL hydrolase family protein n=1 Tax=Rhodococcus sp. B7740 TaxID=1564114 RepID=UPI0005DA00DA|nr:GDSL-type esterase/lipase family protein [Rhodococcus sp. B7740]AJW38589.1 Phage tail fiber protein [Rhodococcus sp. B7740]